MSPFVGRVAELAALRKSLPQDGSGNGRLVAILGDIGMGKTRLMEEFAKVARDHGKRVLWSQMPEDPAVPPYFCWMLALRSCIQQCNKSLLAEDFGPGAADVADILPELSELLGIERNGATSNSGASHFQLFDSVTRFLLNSAARQPLVLMLDNLQSADRSSLALLEYLCQQLAGSPILVVCAYRDSEVDSRHALQQSIIRLSRSAGFIRLLLPGLSKIEVARLLHVQIGRAPMESLVKAVHERSDGNPLFVTEVGSMQARERSSTDKRGARMLIKVPGSLRDVIHARLDMLPESTRRLLAQAAVLGREFDVRILAELSEARTARVIQCLQPAIAAGITVSGAPRRFRFHHALFREVLYAEHNTISRIKLHRRAGEQIEARIGHDPGSYLAELAYHYFEAAQSGSINKAIHYCSEAAAMAVSKRAYSEGAELLDYALQAAELEDPVDNDRQFGLLHRLGHAQYLSGQLSVASRTLLKAAIFAYRRQWWAYLADALFLFQLVCQQSGFRHVASVPLHNAVLENLPSDDTKLRARVLASLAKAWRTAGAPERAADTFRQSIDLARKCGDLNVLHDCLRKGNWTIGRHPAGVRHGLKVSREALELATSLGQPVAVLDSVVDIIFQLCDLGEIDEIERQLSTLHDAAKRERLPHFRTVLTGFETAVAILKGRWDAAIRGANEGMDQVPYQGVHGLQGRHAFQMFAICKVRGTLIHLRDDVDRITANGGDSHFWLPGQILLHCELGQPNLAREGLRSLGRLDALADDDLLETKLIFLAEACLQLGDRHRCAELYSLLLPYRGFNVTLPGTFMLGAVSGYLAELAVATRRVNEATALFEEALDMNKSMGALPALARNQVSLARLLLRSGRSNDHKKVQRLIAAASAVAGDLGLGPVRRAIAEIGNVSVAASLTGREIDILKTIATGLSNNGIAEALNISHSTVATHIRNIFRKICVANRTEAADYARRSGLLDHD